MSQVPQVGIESARVDSQAGASVGFSTLLNDAVIAEGAAKLTLAGTADTVCDRSSDHAGKTVDGS